LLGVAPEKSLLDVLRGEPVENILVETHGITLLPALNGSYALANLDERTRHGLFGAIDSLEDRFETLVVDIAAGIGENATRFAGAVADILIVATPEPLSLADAYACIKVLAQEQHVSEVFLVPNQVRNESDAAEIAARLGSLVSRFLDVKLSSLPWIPRDRAVHDAAVAGVPLLEFRPDAPAARAIRHVARTLDTVSSPDTRRGAVRLFWKRLLQG
jgi:flagellar biosynthesis protein FlhG